MKKLAHICLHLFTFFTTLTIGIGLMTALLFIVAISSGGQFGETLAIFSGQLMQKGILLATLATIVGILHIYLNRSHSLTMNG